MNATFGIAVTDTCLEQYGIGFSGHFSADDLICKTSVFHRLFRIGYSPQQAIFHSPVLTVQYDYLVAFGVLRIKKMMLFNR